MSTEQVAHRLCTWRRLLVASPTYLRRRGEPHTPAALARHDALSHATDAAAESWPLARGDERARVRVSVRCATNAATVLRDLAVDGAGIAVMPPWFVADELRAGRLHVVLPGWGSEPIAAHAIYRARHRGVELRGGRRRWAPPTGGGTLRAMGDDRGIRRLHLASLAGALVVLALTAASMVARPMPCGDLPSSYPPIIAFELARSADDLRAIFGAVGEPCRHRMIDAMDTVNVVDVAAFIPAYTLFLVGAFVGLGRRGRPLAKAGVALAALAAAADVVENLCLFALTPRLDPHGTAMAALPWATGVKWLALGAVGLAAAVALWPGARRHHQLSAALCMVTPIATVAAIAAPHRFGALVGAGVAASWLMLLVDGVAQVRTRGPS